MTIGLFAPLPLAIMIPFMAAQSFAMGDAFGTSFQYGKRKISSLSNEEFNKLDAAQLHDGIQADIRKMIPSMNESFKHMEKFQGEVVMSILKGVVETAKQLIGAGEDIHANLAGDFREGLGLSREYTDSPFETSTSASIYGVQGGSRTGPLNHQQMQEAWDEYVKNRIPSPTEGVGTSKAPSHKGHTHGVHGRTVKPVTTYNKYDPLIKSRPTFDKQALATAKANEKMQILKNIGSLNSQIHNVTVKLDRPERHLLPGYLRTLKDLQKKLANMKTLLRNYR